MCTVTIHRDAASLLVTMNRDEMIARGPEEPPRVFAGKKGAPDWVAPIDTQAAGTWMGANAHGVVACLLNAYLPEDAEGPLPPPGDVSRGSIIPQVLARGPFDSMGPWLREEFDPRLYAPFTLLLMGKGGAMKFRWHRLHGLEEWELDVGWTMVTSALFYMEEIRQFREERFKEWRREGQSMAHLLPTFNLLQVPGREDWSPLVRRDWSGTRSITQVSLGPEDDALEMRYWPDPRPEGGAPGSAVSLPLLRPIESDK